MSLMEELLQELKKIKFVFRWRKNIDSKKKVEGFCLGRTFDINFKNNKNCDERGWCDCILNKRFPVLYQKLKQFALVNNIEYTTIQVNKNVACNPHVDGNNKGLNYFITLGDFTGGETVIDGEIHDAHNKIITFPPHKIHYNLAHEGERFALVFFTSFERDRYEEACYYKYKLDNVDEDLYETYFTKNKLQKIIEGKWSWIIDDDRGGEFSCWCHKNESNFKVLNKNEFYEKNLFRHNIKPTVEDFTADAFHTFNREALEGRKETLLLLFDESGENPPELDGYNVKKTKIKSKYTISVYNRIIDDKEPYIVIKSRDRLDTFEKKSYTKIIKKYGYDDRLVYVFVSDDKDLQEYKERFPRINVIKGDKGIVGIDNFIVNYFPEGQKYIYMNDDVSGVYEALDEKTKRPVQDLKKLMSEIFKEMDEKGSTMGGLYPVLNPYFMARQKNEKNYELCLIMDPVSCCINNKDVILSEVPVKMDDGSIFIGNKTDHEKCILHYKSKGSLVRFNKFGADVEYYNKTGGYRGRTLHTEKISAEFMLEKYPEYISSVRYKKNGNTSLTLRKKPLTKS